VSVYERMEGRESFDFRDEAYKGMLKMRFGKAASSTRLSKLRLSRRYLGLGF
jgi:hypothetical protein